MDSTAARIAQHLTVGDRRAQAHCRDTQSRMKPIGLALVAALAAGCPPRSAAPTAAPPVGLAAGVKGTIEQWRQAYEVRSMDTLAKLYSHDATLAIVQDGAIERGWAAIEPVLRGRLARATAIRVRITELQVAPLAADAAVATGLMTRESTDGTTTVTENGVLTLALRKDDTGWVIAGEHYSLRRLEAIR
jgi:ketosteroid isomerase-like protein